MVDDLDTNKGYSSVGGNLKFKSTHTRTEMTHSSTKPMKTMNVYITAYHLYVTCILCAHTLTFAIVNHI